MLFRTVPALTPRYWVALTLASIFGANLGDFVSHDLHMGHVSGVPYVAAAFVLIAIGGTAGRANWEGWYWLGIVALRTMATNLADLATHDGALGTVPVCATLAATMVALLLIRRATAPATATTGVPRADAGYWLVMLTAGTLGTALGDGIADAVPLPTATVITAGGVLLALSLRVRPATRLVATYWLAIVAIRTFGTNFGDAIAQEGTLAITTPLSGTVLLLALVGWRERTVRMGALAN